VLSFDVSGIPATSTVTAATMSLSRLFGPAAPATVEVHQLTTGWREGTGSATCTGDGVTWYEADGGVPWTAAGGDFAPTVAATVSVPGGGGPALDNFTVTSLARAWVSGGTPNNGVLLRLSDEALRNGNSVVYATDDYSAEPGLRPMLTVTYTE
jgi:hypothetical protein